MPKFTPKAKLRLSLVLGISFKVTFNRVVSRAEPKITAQRWARSDRTLDVILQKNSPKFLTDLRLLGLLPANVLPLSTALHWVMAFQTHSKAKPKYLSKADAKPESECKGEGGTLWATFSKVVIVIFLFWFFIIMETFLRYWWNVELRL